MRNINLTNNESSSTYNTLNFTYILLGVVLGYCISLVAFIASSIIFRFTETPLAILPYFTYLTSLASIIVGGLYTSRQVGRQGWLNGGICGVIYLFGLMLLSFILGVEVVIGFDLVTRFFLAFVAGAVGGILGVNM